MFTNRMPVNGVNFGVLFFTIRNLSSLVVASVNFYTGRHLVQGEEGIEK